MPRLVYFGRLKDAAGRGEELFDLPPGVRTAADLVKALAARDEILGVALGAPSVRLAADKKIIDRDATITQSREIAFMPPMSGG
ncbi:MAG: MoaD/ThiS family protein [Pseudomonadota bacterium]